MTESNTNLFSHSSGARSLKSRKSSSLSEGSVGGSVLASLTSGRCWQSLVSLVCGCITLTFDPIVSLGAFSLHVSLCVGSLLYMDSSHGPGAHPDLV